MYPYRARFKKDIVVEFFAPARDTGKVIIFCDGLPTLPTASTFMNFFHKKGYWVFYPRYRGTWESGGKLFKQSPERDILDVIDQLPKGFTSIWEKKHFKVQPKKLYVFGSSFGGATALLASRDPRIDKVVVCSPVVDWSKASKKEPLDWLRRIVRESFGEAYRFADADWKKLSSGTFFNPAHVADQIDGSKIMIIHAQDDDVVLAKPVIRFAQTIKSKLLLSARGGHFGSRIFTKPTVYKRINRFLKQI